MKIRGLKALPLDEIDERNDDEQQKRSDKKQKHLARRMRPMYRPAPNVKVQPLQGKVKPL